MLSHNNQDDVQYMNVFNHHHLENDTWKLNAVEHSKNKDIINKIFF